MADHPAPAMDAGAAARAEGVTPAATPAPTTAPPLDPQGAPPQRVRTNGSLSWRMISIAALWIVVLLAGGGYALDRVLTDAVTRNFDEQLEYVLKAMIVSAEIGPDGEVVFNREPADQRFLEPYSGLYWQVSAPGREDFPSRSLWDRRLAFGGKHNDLTIHEYDSSQFPNEKLRILERDLQLPGSPVRWRFNPHFPSKALISLS